MIPVGSAVPEGVGVGMVRGNVLSWMQQKCSWNR